MRYALLIAVAFAAVLAAVWLAHRRPAGPPEGADSPSAAPTSLEAQLQAFQDEYEALDKRQQELQRAIEEAGKGDDVSRRAQLQAQIDELSNEAEALDKRYEAFLDAHPELDNSEPDDPGANAEEPSPDVSGSAEEKP